MSKTAPPEPSENWMLGSSPKGCFCLLSLSGKDGSLVALLSSLSGHLTVPNAFYLLGRGPVVCLQPAFRRVSLFLQIFFHIPAKSPEYAETPTLSVGGLISLPCRFAHDHQKRSVDADKSKRRSLILVWGKRADSKINQDLGFQCNS